MAVPEGSSLLQRAAVACYPGHTGKKRLLRRLIRLGFRSRILNLLRPSRPFAPPGMSSVGFDDWLHRVVEILGGTPIWPFVIWPGDPGRGRLYLYFLGANGVPRAFGKLALNEANGEKIRNEARVLESFQASPPQSFCVPRLLASGAWEGADFLVTACLPASASAVDWEKEAGVSALVAEINTTPIVLGAPNPPSWWDKLLQGCRDFPGFEEVIREVSRSGWHACRVHGDLNRTNVLRDGSDLWVIDWEQSREDGPRRTDELCLKVDQWWNQNPDPGAAECRRFFQALFAGKDSTSRAELILALAFLHLLRFSPASTLLQACQRRDFKEFLAQLAKQP